MNASPAGGGLARSSPLHVAFAFVAMGGWGAFANRGHGPQAMLLAGLVQGAISALITLALKRALEVMHARLRGPAALIVPPLVTWTVVLLVLLTAHSLAGTPEVWTTIAVPYTVSSTYAVLYVLVLARGRAS